MKFSLNRLKILRNLFIAVIFLLIGNLIGLFLRFYESGFEHKTSRLFIKLFDFNVEANLPTYFSSLLLLSNGILLALIGKSYKARGKKFWHWIGLSAIFVFLSLDEMVQIHEQLREPMKVLFDTSGFLYFAWFIPYIAVTIVLTIAYFKFMMRLPKRILKLFIIAAVLFISGAVIIEAIGGMHSESHGENNITYALLYTLEELLEMTGSVVFLFGLITYIKTHFNSFQLIWSNSKIDS